MADYFATLSMGTAIDTSGFQKGLQDITNSVKKAPAVDFSKAMAGQKVDSSQAQQILTTIQQTATAIEKITVKQRTFTDALGNTKTGITEMTTSYRDATGQMITVTDKLKSQVDNLGKGWKLTQDVSADVKVGESTRKLTALMQGRIDANDKIAKQGQELATKSQNWDTDKRQKMQDLNTTLQQQVLAYETIAKSQDRTGLKQADANIKKTKEEMDALNNSVKTGAGAFSSFGVHLENAFKQVSAYTIAMAAWRAAQNFLNDAIKFTVELNKEMVKIQVLQAAGAQTPEQISNLARSYNDLAKEMGVTTAEVAKGSVEWLRQGKTIAETTELLRASTMLSKLGNLQAAEATEYLTSTLNSFKMGSEEAVSVVDKLIAVDNKSATSSKELATALRYSAAMADGAGVSLEQLISYIGVVSSTTRQNAESIGQGMKTMLARMQDIKAGAIDEDGLGINNVDIALKRVGMSITDASGEFKDMGPVLEELAGKWDTLSSKEQENIAKAIAGIRQQNMFKILMQEMPQALKLQEDQLNSNGLAMDRYNFYLESIEGSQNKLKASLEGFMLTFKAFDGLIIVINTLASSFLNMLTAIGGIPTILSITLVILGLFIAQGNIATAMMARFSATTLGGAVASMWALITSLVASIPQWIATAAGAIAAGDAMTFFNLTNPVGWLIILAGVLVGVGVAFNALVPSIADLNEKFTETNKELEDLGKKRKSVDSLTAEYKKLSQISVKTAEEQQRFYDVQNDLKELMPELTGSFDIYGNFIISSTDSLEKLTGQTTKHIEELKKEKQQMLDNQAVELAQALTRSKTVANAPKIEGAGAAGLFAIGGLGGPIATYFWNQYVDKTIEEQPAVLAQTKASFMAMGEEAQNEFIAALTNDADKAEFIRIQAETLKEAAAEGSSAYYESWMRELFRQGKIPAPPIDTESLMTDLEGIQNKIKTVKDLANKFNSGEILNPGEMSVFQDATEGLDLLTASQEDVNDAVEVYINKQYDELLALNNLTGPQKEYLENQRAIALATNESAEALDKLMSAQSAVNAALKENKESGQISIETALSLIDKGYASALVINTQTGEIRLNTAALKANQIAAAEVAVATAKEAWDKVNSTAVTEENTDKLWAEYQARLALLQLIKGSAYGEIPELPTLPGSTSSGGGSGQTAEQIAAEARIKVLEERKKKLQEALDEFKRYIDAQKESLKLAKEEKEYMDSIVKKNKSLAEIKTQIALLALDTSQEAQAKRTELEDQAAGLEEDIAKEQADRVYELQIQALDKVMDEFEENMNKKMKKLDDEIAKLQDVASATQDVGGATGDLGDTAAETAQKIMDGLTGIGDLAQSEKDAILAMITELVNSGASLDYIILKAQKAINELLRANTLANNIGSSRGGGYADEGGEFSAAEEGQANQRFHEGGMVKSYHRGNFAGDLKSNEVFAKLLKGEYVATEGQMNNFMKNILPSMAYGKVSPNAPSSSNGNITVNMPINVSGNLDKSVIPDINKVANQVVKEINRTLRLRGSVRSVNQTII